MTKAYRSADEQELLSLRSLERRVANLERSGAGLAATTAQLGGTTALTTGNVAFVTLNIVRPGRYEIIGVCDFQWGVVSAGNVAVGSFTATGHLTLGTAQILLAGDTLCRATIGQVVFGTWAGAGTIILNALKSGAGGTCNINAQHTTLTAIRTGPV